MDGLIILRQIAEHKNKVEKMNSNPNPKEYGVFNSGTILCILIGAYAAYVSYECNSKKNMPELTKIIFAIFAYVFGLFYLIYFYLFQYDKCENI